MATVPAYKARCYDVTVQIGHLNGRLGTDEEELGLGNVFLQAAEMYEDGLLDYAALAYETPRGGTPHIQGFITFAPLAYSDERHYRSTDKGSRFTPSKVFQDIGSFRQVRSISGARDYCVRAGIHAGKSGLHFAAEYGDFVDPAWNLSMRSRTTCMLYSLLDRGHRPETIESEFPQRVALLGGNQWSDLKRLSRGAADRTRCLLRPYYYIGLENLRDDALPQVQFDALRVEPEEKPSGV